MPMMGLSQFLFTDVEVTGIAGLAGAAIAAQTAIILKLIDSREKDEDRAARERHEDRETIRQLTTGINAAVTALKETREMLVKGQP